MRLGGRTEGMSELRFHPFLGEWVITATHRQDRTYHPPAGYCPLCPTQPGGFPTEIPLPDYEIAVFENRFPSLASPPPAVAWAGTDLIPSRPAEGRCEVICYSSDHEASLATLTAARVRNLVRVWQDRFRVLAENESSEYVFIFENRGVEIGVTLSHPHGQIYAYPFLPPTVRRSAECEQQHFDRTGAALMVQLVESWRRDPSPIVSEFEPWLTVVPPFARLPYETWIVTEARASSLIEVSEGQLDALAAAIQDAAQRLDRLFDRPMPYVMAIHQRPPKADWPWFRMRVEFLPILRTAEKQKFLAGSELACGAFINDTLPEESAKRLREI